MPYLTSPTITMTSQLSTFGNTLNKCTPHNNYPSSVHNNDSWMLPAISSARSRGARLPSFSDLTSNLNESAQNHQPQTYSYTSCTRQHDDSIVRSFSISPNFGNSPPRNSTHSTNRVSNPTMPQLSLQEESFIKTFTAFLQKRKAMVSDIDWINLSMMAFDAQNGRGYTLCEDFESHSDSSLLRYHEWVLSIPDTALNQFSENLHAFSMCLDELKAIKSTISNESKNNIAKFSTNAMVSNNLNERNTLQLAQATLLQKSSRSYSSSTTSSFPSPRNGLFTETAKIMVSQHSSSPTVSLNSISNTNTPKLNPSTTPLQSNNGIVTTGGVKIGKKRGRRQKRRDILCKHCNLTNTPEWRKGPEGSRTLCNACGLFYSKLVKRFGFKDASIFLRYRKENNQVLDRALPSMKLLKEIVDDEKYQ